MPRENPQYSQTSVRSAYPDYPLENYRDDTAREWVNQTDPRASGYVRARGKVGRLTVTLVTLIWTLVLSIETQCRLTRHMIRIRYMYRRVLRVLFIRHKTHQDTIIMAYYGNQNYPSNPTPAYPGGSSTSNSYYPQNMGRQNSWFDPQIISL